MFWFTSAACSDHTTKSMTTEALPFKPNTPKDYQISNYYSSILGRASELRTEILTCIISLLQCPWQMNWRTLPQKIELKWFQASSVSMHINPVPRQGEIRRNHHKHFQTGFPIISHNDVINRQPFLYICMYINWYEWHKVQNSCNARHSMTANRTHMDLRCIWF